MTTARQAASNRRNAQHSTGPRTQPGKDAVRMNALKHGMTAKVAVLPNECDLDYERYASLIESYAPANEAEFMLVDQIVAGYWRAIRARRFETAMFDNQIRTRKIVNGINPASNPDHDDEACAVILQIESPESMRNLLPLRQLYFARLSRHPGAGACPGNASSPANPCRKMLQSRCSHITSLNWLCFAPDRPIATPIRAWWVLCLR